ncbi:NYN domain-containing protein [Phaeodactylibacter luteus]|uniref:NYN domain-containing protein n=1 Tax=Phaeodactylibacter luteus TaxID=1564516 RepID=A0A5C6S949_9BACT|nr:NYN domain-containing protein [Phaeodactylibacter luteus]TXB70232.1 NYN domain-containing protein [Phaeodactylibacter luteus]
MNTTNGAPLLKVGVFYDGNYFYHVSNFYNYVHERKTRISIKGLHEFVRHKVAELESDGTNVNRCQIVDAHYFRGRLSASEVSHKGKQLYYERVFDDILMSEGVTTHYLPLRNNGYGRKAEKGIDVWLALEAFEQVIHKQFDVLVLIASDSDYVPLIRKVNSRGTRVMVLSWDFEYTDDYGNRRSTRTSQDLLEEVTYPLAMHEIIDNRVTRDSFIVNNLFVPKTDTYKRDNGHSSSSSYEEEAEEQEYEEPKITVSEDGTFHSSTILSLKEGFGFIAYPPNNLFFHHSEVQNCDYNDLLVGDIVEFRIGKNETTGQDIAIEVYLQEDEDLPIEDEGEEA